MDETVKVSRILQCTPMEKNIVSKGGVSQCHVGFAMTRNAVEGKPFRVPVSL